MNPCADSRPMRLLGLLLAASLFAGCASVRTTSPDQPAPPDSTGEPAEPAADLGDPEARFAEALDLMRTRQTAEAEAAFVALTRDFPEFSGPYTNLGILLAQGNRRNEAVAMFVRAAAANPDNVSAYNWLGTLHRESGNYAEARAAYEKALAVNPDYAAARLNLGLLYDDYLRQPSEALTQYREYLRVTGGNDLRVLPWIGEIEAQLAAQASPAAPADAPEQELK